MKVVIVKYNAGNIQSVLFALERIGVEAVVTDDVEQIRSAAKVIFPGVGEASSAMRYLRERGLDEVIRSLTQPVLGICLGMQLLCKHSSENDTDCLGLVPVNVKRFDPGYGMELRNLKDAYKIPQMGWNDIYDLQTDLFTGIPENSYVYHVHSYYAEDSRYTVAKCKYGIEYATAIKKDNFYGVQFHAEKSASVGEQLLKNFLVS